MSFITQEKSKRFIVVVQFSDKAYIRNTNDKKWVELSIRQFTHGSDIIELYITDLEKGIFTTYRKDKVESLKITSMNQRKETT